MNISKLKCLALITYTLNSGCAYSMGNVDGSSTTAVTGWACDTRYSNDIVAVHAWRDDNKFLGGTDASFPREPAVGAACGGGHSSHGFTLQFTISENMKDGKEHRVYLYSIGQGGFVEHLNNSPRIIKFPGKSITEYPKALGNIVARDLAWPVIGGAGHIGVWDGAYVIEALNEPSAIKKNTYEDFNKRSEVWPILKPRWPTHTVIGCFSSRCTEYNNAEAGKSSSSATYAMISRANQIIAIGADYTWQGYGNVSFPQVYFPADLPYSSARTWPPLRGKYRCDTFIKDIIRSTVRSPGQYQSEYGGDGAAWAPSRIINQDITDWYRKYNEIEGLSVTTPLTVYNKIKSWQ